jgi:radical SAM superfamily enzyme YgiQ (UPF0313 family)
MRSAAREAFPDVPLVIGSIEASLRRIAHYDYWSDKVRRSILPDSKADLLIFGNAERAHRRLAHRLAKGEAIDIRDLRGTAFMVPRGWLPGPDWAEIDSTRSIRRARYTPIPTPTRWKPKSRQGESAGDTGACASSAARRRGAWRR